LSSRKSDEYHDEQNYAMVKEEHCKGHEEDRELTIDEYRKEQGVEEYDELNRTYYQIILKRKSAGPSIGSPTPTSFQFFFMAAFDIDRFNDFLKAPNFRKMYNITDKEFKTITTDDVERLKFSYRLLKQVLFGEQSIPMHDGAYDERMEERKGILEMRRQAEIELAKQKDPIEKFIDD
jgi:hypothetical protein